MKFVCVDVILGCRVSALYSYKWLSNGQDVRNGGHYKTINRWREPIRVIISEKMRPTWSWLKMICCGNSWVQSKSFIKLVFVSVLSIQLHIQIVIHRVHKKTRKFVFLPMSLLLLGQIQKVLRSVLKSAHSEDFKTVLTFDFWPSRSWDNWC